MTENEIAEMAKSKVFATAQRPADSATLIIVRRDGGRHRILLGQRSHHHEFMPGKYVFPGGRYDADDGKMEPVGALQLHVLDKLLVKMRGRPSISRARGLALAAVRETFEEVGLIIGKPATGHRAPNADWQLFIDAGHAPDLSGLVFFARAITPPGRTRRFDSRFFVVDADHVANLDAPHHAGTGELLTPHWFTYAETRSLDLPIITNDILTRLNTILEAGTWPTGPVCFQYQVNGKWREETL